jgi:hypothetical protein
VAARLAVKNARDTDGLAHPRLALATGSGQVAGGSRA